VTPERLATESNDSRCAAGAGPAPGARGYHESLARIEVAKSELESAFAAREAIVKSRHGSRFTYVSLDLAGLPHRPLNALLPVVR